MAPLTEGELESPFQSRRALFLVVPAYQPALSLFDLVQQAVSSHAFREVVVVDDGSRGCAEVFERVRALPTVTVLSHAVNLGKGAALKSALNLLLVRHGEDIGIVTMDADGQHALTDVLAVAEQVARHPDSLVLGVRGFAADVPLRSRLGNWLTRHLARLLVGVDVGDTQTGLRGVPGWLCPRLLLLQSQRYEFELDMLVLCSHLSVRVREHPITTIYLDRNQSSHFNPLTDSVRIYAVLFRFVGAALVSAVVDNLLFMAALAAGFGLGAGHAHARVLSLTLNYVLLRRYVFLSDQLHAKVLPKYLLVVVLWGAGALFAIQQIVASGILSAVVAKVVVESLLFPLNFVVQRSFVFSRRGPRS